MIFKKADWIKNTDVYEVNIRQYSLEGTFKAFEKQLPRLKDMGVSTLWFMPITPISRKLKKGTMGSSYACSDYKSINPEFGNLEDFKSTVKIAHDLGFKIIIDWVANHTGWDHVWTNTNPEYYKKDLVTGDFKIASGMDDIIELDYDNPSLRASMIDSMKYWITECDIDGFRCDLAFWVRLDFWMEARTELEKTKTLFWLAESDPLENPDYYNAFDACYTWTWMHQTADFYKNHQNKNVLDGILNRYNLNGNKENIKLWFTSNHDENSWNGTEYEKYGELAKTLAVHSFTWEGIPLIYSGQELPNLKRLQFFEKDAIDWSEKLELYDFYKTLLKLRKDNPALRAGDVESITIILHTNFENNVLVYLRKNGEQEVLVLLNFSSQLVEFSIMDENLGGSFKDIFTEINFDFTEIKSFELIPWAYKVFEKK
jgi:glycosidase